MRRLVVLDFAVGVDAGHDEKTAVGFAIFPIAQVDDVALFTYARKTTQRPRRDDAIGREEDNRMRIDQGCLDETSATIGRCRGRVIGIGDGWRLAVVADRLGELAVYRILGEFDRLLANIVSACAIRFFLDRSSLHEKIVHKIEWSLIGSTLVLRLKNPSLFDLERRHSVMLVAWPRIVGDEALKPRNRGEDIVPHVPAVAASGKQDAAALVAIRQRIERNENGLAGVRIVPLVRRELESNFEHRKAGRRFDRGPQFAERAFCNSVPGFLIHSPPARLGNSTIAAG